MNWWKNCAPPPLEPSLKPPPDGGQRPGGSAVPQGLTLNRGWLLVLKDGRVVVDWGENIFQDLASGQFIESVDLIGSRAIGDDELAWLKRTGQVLDYDAAQVFLGSLPERRRNPLD